MAKQIGRITLEQKIAAKNVEASAQQKYPCPTSDQLKYGRKKEKFLMAFALEITEAEEFFPNLVAGIEGSYLVGIINRGDDSEGQYFTVKTIKLPQKYDKPAYERLVIEGEIAFYGKKVHIPHFWLFIKPETITFVWGYIGEVQREMLNFLQRVLFPEIPATKRVRYEAMQTAKAAEKATETASTVQIVALATITKKVPRPLSLAAIFAWFTRRFRG